MSEQKKSADRKSEKLFNAKEKNISMNLNKSGRKENDQEWSICDLREVLKMLRVGEVTILLGRSFQSEGIRPK